MEYSPEFKKNFATAYLAEEYEHLEKEATEARDAAGADPEALVGGLMKQGWPEFDARQVLDAALTGATTPTPVVASRAPQTQVMNYAQPRPAVRQQSYASAGDRSRHVTQMLVGGGLLAIGLVITVVSFSAASNTGGTYFLCWGPILFGAIRLITGFIGFVSNS